MEIFIGGADQGEFVFVRDGEDNPAIRILENIGALMVKQLVDNNMAAFDHANVFFGLGVGDMVLQLVKPGTGSVHQHLCLDLKFFVACFIK